MDCIITKNSEETYSTRHFNLFLIFPNYLNEIAFMEYRPNNTLTNILKHWSPSTKILLQLNPKSFKIPHCPFRIGFRILQNWYESIVSEWVISRRIFRCSPCRFSLFAKNLCRRGTFFGYRSFEHRNVSINNWHLNGKWFGVAWKPG